MPAVNELFEDRRVSTGVATLLYQAVVRIPLGTVLLEEIAFRSVLPALLATRLGVLRGVDRRRRCCSACGTSCRL